MKLTRYTECTKVGHDGCVNTEGAEYADAGWMHYCPACLTMHAIAVERPLGNGARWTFNGDMERPTFQPSVRINYPTMRKPRTCHYFIEGGLIKYCGDCTHSMSGQTIPLPDIPGGEL